MKGKVSMKISKLKLGWTAFCGLVNPFGSMVGNITDYLLDVLNSSLANLSDATKEKIESVLATAKNVMGLLLKFQFLVPARWQYAYRETIEAVDSVIYALEDIQLTPDELVKIKKEFDEAVRAWKDDDPVFYDKTGTMSALTFFAVMTVFCVGCTSYEGGKVVDGTNIEIGVAVPGTEWTINALSYTGGMRVCGNNATIITVTNAVTETNSYFGIVKTSRNTRMSASITPSTESPSDSDAKK